MDYKLLRIFIGYLGEKAEPNWWVTNYFTESFESFLTPVFPKTAHLAQYHGISEAARRVHDEHIGVGNAYHLFRLPDETEQILHRSFSQGEQTGEFYSSLTSKESVLDSLNGGNCEAIEINEGPLLVGKIDLVLKKETIAKLARIYSVAFKNNVKTFPYFAG